MDKMSRFARHSITFRMTVAVCAFLLLFQAILASLTFFYFRRELKQTITAQQFNMLNVVTKDIDQKLAASLKVIVDVSRQVTPEITADSAAAQLFLDKRPGTHSVFDNGLFLFSPEGKIIAESPYIPGRRGRDISFRDYYRKTLSSGKPVISEPYVSTHTPGAPAVMFTAPVRDENGRLVAILGGSLNLLNDNFLGELSRTKIAKTGYLYVITRGRTLIMHPDRSRIMQSPEVPGANKLLDAAISGFEGSGENINSRGLHALTSFKAFKATDWILGANYPIAEAYEPIWRLQKYLILLTAIGTAILVIVLRMMMGGFTRSLVSFADHVRNIGSKQGEERLFNIDSNDEVALLARTFNTMIQSADIKSAELHRASTHDSMTGLFNRAYFDSELERLARGRQTPISVVVADIDGLKKCNDTIGHAAGDELIKLASHVFMESFRTEDIVARIGGDEFAVLLPGVDVKQVEMALERVRSAEASTAPITGGVRLSVSLGYATVDASDELEVAFKEADRQMYIEKAARRHVLV